MGNHFGKDRGRALSADNEFKVSTLNEIVIGKLAKRGISMKSIEQCDPDISPLGHARQSIKIKHGIESAVAKEITGFIRDGKFKVTTQIQGDQEVRVNGKSRDRIARGHRRCARKRFSRGGAVSLISARLRFFARRPFSSGLIFEQAGRGSAGEFDTLGKNFRGRFSLQRKIRQLADASSSFTAIG